MGEKTPRPYAEIGQRIQDARRGLPPPPGARRVTQAELAKRVGVHEGTVAAWEGGYQKPEENLPALAEELGVSEDYIIHGAGGADLFEDERALGAVLTRGALVRFAETDKGRQALKALRDMAPGLGATVEQQNRMFALLNGVLHDAEKSEP